jgi:Ca2+-binding EF-hand superfamily protein
MVMEKYLQESLDLITKELDEADPDEFLEEFLRFQKQSDGGITIDELIATFDISV